ncbi:MAG: hypothetical protein K2L37_06405 [Lactobacillus sp.]|nr:hypothetical protein [Lactobacillus sp.]
MDSDSLMSSNDIPDEGLRFFHSLSNWVEQIKGSHPAIIKWKNGQRQLTKLQCIKPCQKESITLPHVLPDNTLFIPISSGGLSVIRQLRHAFCHNGLTYDRASMQYEINQTNQIKIVGRFSLDAIKEFVSVYCQLI